MLPAPLWGLDSIWTMNPESPVHGLSEQLRPTIRGSSAACGRRPPRTPGRRSPGRWRRRPAAPGAVRSRPHRLPAPCAIARSMLRPRRAAGWPRARLVTGLAPASARTSARWASVASAERRRNACEMKRWRSVWPSAARSASSSATVAPARSRASSACFSSNSAPASASTWRRCSSVASADRRRSACETKRWRSVMASASCSALSPSRMRWLARARRSAVSCSRRASAASLSSLTAAAPIRRRSTSSRLEPSGLIRCWSSVTSFRCSARMRSAP